MDKSDNKDWSENLNKIEEKSDDHFSFLEFVWDLLKTAIVVVVIAFGIKYFVVQPFIVDGNSMEASFHNNEYLLVEKIGYHFHQPNRGDVIIFHPPGQANENYIKRVVGLPDETVEVIDNKVKIINPAHPEGVFLQEPYISANSKTVVSGTENKFSVGSNEVFVLGDNREHSSDSREWGTLPIGNIIGRAWLDIYPFDQFGLVKHWTFGS